MPRYPTAYPPEFRRQMVDLVRSGRTPEEVAREFEPTAQSISTWVKQVERDAVKRPIWLRANWKSTSYPTPLVTSVEPGLRLMPVARVSGADARAFGAPGPYADIYASCWSRDAPPQIASGQRGTRVDSSPSASKASEPFWTQPLDAAFAELTSTAQGLAASEAAGRLATLGPNTDAPPRKTSLLAAIARRFLEPLILLLLFAAGVSAATADASSASIIAAIIIVSVALDAFQEGRAAKAADALKQSVALKADVRRDGQFLSLPTADVVPGDVFRVRAGDVVPADALVLEVSSFTANEAALTGEPYPVEKRPGPTASDSPAEATNALFRGSIAQTGEATALAVARRGARPLRRGRLRPGRGRRPIPLPARLARPRLRGRARRRRPIRRRADDQPVVWAATDRVPAMPMVVLPMARSPTMSSRWPRPSANRASITRPGD